MKRKNFLWILTDQLRPDISKYMGNDWIKTPTINQLIEEGTLFDNFHTNSPVCVPSRISMLTGKYTHELGIADNKPAPKGFWPEEYPSFTEMMSDDGYISINFGKTHYPKRDIWDYDDSFRFFKDEVFLRYMHEDFTDEDYSVTRLDTEGKGAIISGIYPTRVEGRTATSHLTDLVIEHLKGLKTSEKPFFLRASYVGPHTPVMVPKEYFNLYDPDKMDFEVLNDEMFANLPLYEQEMINTQDVTLDEIKRARATYFAFVTYLDHQFGRLIQTLKEEGLYEDTYIIFSTDHGCLLGEYGRFMKNVFRDQVTRSPLVICGPDIEKGKVISDIREAVDLAPTFMNLAGIDCENQFSGKPLFRQDSTNNIYGEYFRPKGKVRRSWIANNEYSLDITYSVNGTRTTTLEEYDGKLVDLKKDRYGHQNLFYKAEYKDVVEQMVQQLLDKLQDNAVNLQVY